MKKIFENPYAELYDISDEVPHTIFGYWKGYWQFDDTEAMEALHFPFNYIREHQIKVMITDYQYLEVIPQDTAEWIDKVWFPTVVAHGLIAEIVLDASELIGQLTVDFMYENVNHDTGLYTPKVDTLEHAKKLALQFINDLQKKGLLNLP
ncbi:MAG TPA: hypothetical protein DCM08_04670 [Microscillaceae bacterium]|jgi:hypothetical protein|nr:hypothetical protein [Microscillaceae bacterium]